MNHLFLFDMPDGTFGVVYQDPSECRWVKHYDAPQDLFDECDKIIDEPDWKPDDSWTLRDDREKH